MNSEIKFNVAYIKLMTEIEGPFKRCCIWFQGCNIHCKGCCNTELQELKPNHIVSLNQLTGIVKEAKEKYDIEEDKSDISQKSEPVINLRNKLNFNDKPDINIYSSNFPEQNNENILSFSEELWSGDDLY